MSSFFADLFDPLGLFHTTSSKEQSNDQWQASYDLQKDAFEYQKQYDKWAQGITEQNLNLQKSPVSTIVSDGSSVGVNPMAALGQSVGSVSASQTATGSPSGLAPINNMPSLVQSLTGLAETSMQVSAERDIAKDNQNLRRQELKIIEENNKGNLSARSAELENTKVETSIKRQLANANDKMTELEFEKFAHQKTKDIKTYLLEKADQDFRHKFSDKEYALKVSQFNKQFDEMVREFNEKVKTADRDRRMQYITRFSGQVTRLLGSIFGRGGGFEVYNDSGYQDTKIGF